MSPPVEGQSHEILYCPGCDAHRTYQLGRCIACGHHGDVYRDATFTAATREWLDTAEDALHEFLRLLELVEDGKARRLIGRLDWLANSGDFRAADIAEAYRAVCEVKARWDSNVQTEVTA